MYTPVLPRKQVEKELSKLQKLNYNRFRWWRLYQPRNTPLHPKQPLRDRILNGDFDYSCYKMQVYWCEHELNDILHECNGDYQMYLEKSAVLLARKKRLNEDFEKDESERLKDLITGMTRHFKCSKEQVEEEMIECIGSLLDLYYIIEEKYNINHIPQSLKKRGRPKKNI
tara:strand:+ start:1943 stop:2452 length:510 start_codon:yes stop_codon:yes gene_type:complete